MNFNEKMEKPEDNKEPILSEQESKQGLIELAVNFAKTNPKLAEEYFKKAGVSMPEIENALAQQEFKSAEEKEKDRSQRIAMRQEVKEMYNKIIADAKEKGDEERARIYEAALAELKKVEDK